MKLSINYETGKVSKVKNAFKLAATFVTGGAVGSVVGYGGEKFLNAFHVFLPKELHENFIPIVFGLSFINTVYQGLKLRKLAKAYVPHKPGS